eukprot:TRINITY_DN311_c0_g2_i5.p1 TRINITY_DN311_c0_g2~~TRINITY_DN311_c0_g2_i5.p1  ORF type:complete len:220 (-),score=77.75 TRINITY_DN311_c0_g2_i5:445-1104(-)
MDDIRMELDTLQAIYMDDFQELTENKIFTIKLFATETVDSGEDKYGVILKIELPEGYPNTLPLISFQEKFTLPNQASITLLEELKALAESNVGNVMGFTLCQMAKEWLDNSFLLFQENQKEREKEEKEREEEEERQSLGIALDPSEKPLHGGPAVTRESFLEWKKLFDQEMAEKNKTKISSENRPTGRQMFESDSSMINSDASLLSSSLDEGEQTAENE